MARPAFGGDCHKTKPAKLFLYNSLTGQKEPFEPNDPACVKWYSCGPTVYDLAHLGHARSYMAFDIMRRLLENYFGYTVIYVMNITDIDDKIIKRARSWHLFDHWLKDTLEQYSINGRLTVQPIYNLVKQACDAQQSKLKEITDPAKVEMIDKMMKSSAGVVDTLKQSYDNNAISSDSESVKKIESILRDLRDLLADYLDSQSGHEITDLAIFKQLAELYEREFLNDMAQLNIMPPTVITRVSDYIPETVEYIKRVEANGYAYQSNGSVYFDTDKFRAELDDSAAKTKFTYPKLRPEAFGHKDSLNEGEGELSTNTTTIERRSANHFALWKNSKPGEPRWATAFGEGRPGWHIECSVMAHETLGHKLDIHSGGEDLKFPHHDNEIAQADAHYNTGHDWVRYFLHSGHLTISGCKMSKSLKNFITIRDALAKYSSRQLRLLFLLHGWGDQLDYSSDTMQESLSYEKTINEFLLNVADKIRRESMRSEPLKWKVHDSELIQELADLKRKVDEALCDNLNTKSALIQCREAINKCNKFMDQCHPGPLLKIALFIQNILSIFGCDFNSGIKFEGHSASNEGAPSDDKFASQIAYILADFRGKVRDLSKKQAPPCELSMAQLKLCDELRDEVLPEIGVRFEDKEIDGKSHTAVKIVDRETALRERELQRQIKLERERLKAIKDQEKADRKQELDKNGPKKLSPPSEMFREQTDRFSRFDDNGLPTHDAEGKEISDSQRKKLMRLYKEREKKYQKSIQ